jgi:hypothetical protein
VLQQAAELKKQGKPDEARKLVLAEGVLLWLKLAPLVREALLDFQEVVSTRNDLGTLASMHNKYERLALFRLRASMKEFLGDLPPETERLHEEVRRPDSNALLRVFIPTRPTLLRPIDRVRAFAVVPRPKEVARVTLFTRLSGHQEWTPTPMKLVGRNTFVAELAVGDATQPLLDYYVEAELFGSTKKPRITAPLEAPARYYTATVL